MSYTRNNPTLAPSYEKPAGKKKGAAEYLMYGFVIVLVAIVAIASYVHFAPAMKEVPNRVAEGFERDRINIVLIGVGGNTHPGEGKDLADSIILTSLKPSTGQVALISLPRDLYVPMDNGIGMQRLNAAHSLGAKIGFKGRGPGFLIHTVEKVLNEPVHAYVRIDFLAFEKVVDALGGVDVYVYRPFHDYLFNDGFEQGWQHLNGKRALRYARYRYIKDSYEGNNFGRELRQQQVVDAIRAKLKNLDAAQVLRLARLAMGSSEFTSTNLTTPQMVELYGKFRKTERADMRHVSLKQFTKIIKLTEPGLYGEAVAPPKNDYTKIREVVKTVFNGKGPIVAESEIQLTEVAPPPAAAPVIEPGKPAPAGVHKQAAAATVPR